MLADPATGREERLILELVTSQLLAGRGRGGRIRVDGIEWGRLVAVARAHGVLPLVRRALTEDGIVGLASEERAIVDGAADIAARQCLLMTSTLLQLLAELSSADIAAVPWKGPVLATLLWSDVAMRQYADLDLLVSRHDIDRARDLLMGSGFRRTVPLEAWQEPTYVERNGALEMVRDRDGLVVEIHWTVVPNHYSAAMDPEGLWHRLEEVSIARRAVWTLAPEDLLIALSIHGFKHRWERLGWIADIARLLQVRSSMDWAAIRERTGRAGSQRLVRIAVGLAADLFPAAGSAQGLEALGADDAATRIVKELRGPLFSRFPDGHVANASALHFRGRERHRDRVAYVATAATRSTMGDWAAIALPQRMFGFYRLVRPVRILARYLRARRGL